MKIAVLKEIVEGETRVAITPQVAKKLVSLGYDVCIEKEAGKLSGFSDEEYVLSGANITKDAKATYENADMVLKIWAPLKSEDKFLKPNMNIIANFQALYDVKRIEDFKRIGAKCFALDLMPRISRAQNVDILSSQSNLAGYMAVVKAAELSKRAFPMMMTSAGTISPVKVLILGVGVAGLQAIATAKRMGALVFANDIRPETKEQTLSLGAKFVETEEIADQLAKTDILITTAMVAGAKAPVLVKKEMLGKMPNNAIVIDMASEKGGNVEGSVEGKVVEVNGITIFGHSNLAQELPNSASFLYANNLFNFVSLIKEKIDMNDEIIHTTLIAGEIK